jgi:hypothetical protein
LIISPYPGQHVVLWYAEKKRFRAPYHGSRGLIVKIAQGPGPKNIAVLLDNHAGTVVVPFGNLMTETQVETLMVKNRKVAKKSDKQIQLF